MKGLIVLGIGLLLLMAGCVNQSASTDIADTMMEKPTDTMMKEDGGAMEKDDDAMMENSDGTMVKDDETMMEKNGNAMMAKGIEYQPFSKAAYDAAKADGKIIFLEFYANWCPTCKAQHPALVEGLGDISSENLVAFQVNYKDSETDADETELAKQYNIILQHTHVVTNAAGETLLKSNENWSTQDVVDKLGVFA